MCDEGVDSVFPELEGSSDSSIGRETKHKTLPYCLQFPLPSWMKRCWDCYLAIADSLTVRMSFYKTRGIAAGCLDGALIKRIQKLYAVCYSRLLWGVGCMKFSYPYCFDIKVKYSPHFCCSLFFLVTFIRLREHLAAPSCRNSAPFKYLYTYLLILH